VYGTEAGVELYTMFFVTVATLSDGSPDG